jgi:hypothetical protein
MNRATILDLEQYITLELEAAQHEHRRRGPHRNTPLDATLPLRSEGSRKNDLVILQLEADPRNPPIRHVPLKLLAKQIALADAISESDQEPVVGGRCYRQCAEQQS